MKFVFDNRPSDSAFVEAIWRTQSEGGGSFMSAASSNMEIVITKQKNAVSFTVHGPLTRAFQAPVPDDAEFFGITFKLGIFMPYLPASELVDGGINLPGTTNRSFWLQGAAWQLPNFENADTFVDRLVRQGLLAHEPIVEAALQGQSTALSLRSVQRRFRRVTGLTQGTMLQIERARCAMTLLQQGVSILDTVEQAGFYDQAHLTRSLKHLVGQTPAQIMNSSRNE